MKKKKLKLLKKCITFKFNENQKKENCKKKRYNKTAYYSE